ncbi:hypothetical protein VVT58_24285 (plasmid) [Sphingobium sp. SJ10-10]|uniref:hypothetical protein n=1 Tax=Sphingobium sp. SJ10-10 TaxID=3114999 RepID=UPI002E193AD5|nr:hypothetical protein [Sphingobium sp. SJ10-10]
MLVLDQLLGGLKEACAAFPDKRKSDAIYSMADIGLSAFSLFFMQFGIIPVLSALAGGGAQVVELPDAVRDGADPDRQSHPRDARSGPSLASAAGVRSGDRRA